MKSKFVFQWIPEIKRLNPHTSFLLIGTQVDLREDAATLEKLAQEKQKPTTIDQGNSLAKKSGAVKYIECSSVTKVSNGTRMKQPFVINYLQENLTIVFDEAIIAASAVKKKGGCCTIM